jgi:hypothetical protein
LRAVDQDLSVTVLVVAFDNPKRSDEIPDAVVGAVDGRSDPVVDASGAGGCGTLARLGVEVVDMASYLSCWLLARQPSGHI